MLNPKPPAPAKAEAPAAKTGSAKVFGFFGPKPEAAAPVSVGNRASDGHCACAMLLSAGRKRQLCSQMTGSAASSMLLVASFRYYLSVT